jgi:hypothetical protein
MFLFCMFHYIFLYFFIFLYIFLYFFIFFYISLYFFIFLYIFLFFFMFYYVSLYFFIFLYVLLHLFAYNYPLLLLRLARGRGLDATEILSSLLVYILTCLRSYLFTYHIYIFVHSQVSIILPLYWDCFQTPIFANFPQFCLRLFEKKLINTPYLCVFFKGVSAKIEKNLSKTEFGSSLILFNFTTTN